MPKDTLTEQSYARRKAELTQHIVAAEADHARLAYKVELREAKAVELETSRASIATLKDRLAGLERAKEDALDAAEAEAQHRDRERRAAARKAIDGFQDERETAAQLLVSGVAMANGAVAAYQEAGRKIAEAATPFLSGEQRADLIHATNTMFGNPLKLYDDQDILTWFARSVEGVEGIVGPHVNLEGEGTQK
jgi:hypothetical protein